VQYWLYSQLSALGGTGRTAQDKPVFTAMREVEAYQKNWMKERRAAER